MQGRPPSALAGAGGITVNGSLHLACSCANHPLIPSLQGGESRVPGGNWLLSSCPDLPALLSLQGEVGRQGRVRVADRHLSAAPSPASLRSATSPGGRGVAWSAALLLGLILTACSRPTTPPAAPGADTAKPTVVATIFPLADITRSLAGDAFAVRDLLPAGASPHTFELTPQTAKALADALVVVRVGAGVDAWLENAMQGSQARVVTVTELTTLLPGTDEHEGEPAHPGEAEHEHGHEHEGAGNPHVWLDPVLMRDTFAPAIAEALKQANPAAAETVTANLAGLTQQLTALDAELTAKLADLPERRYIAGHRAWEYFNRRYGLSQVAVVEPKPGTDPSARYVKEVVEIARREKVTAVFGEVQLSQALSELVSREAGVKTGLLDPLGGEQTAGRDSYAALLRYNAEQFATGLKP